MIFHPALPALFDALPLFQIVLLVTKAVGDLLGTKGIADEMIRFNGFPFLEREDHAYNVSGMTNLFVIVS